MNLNKDDQDEGTPTTTGLVPPSTIAPSALKRRLDDVTFDSDEAQQNDLKRARITRADDAYLSNLVVDAGEVIDVRSSVPSSCCKLDAEDISPGDQRSQPPTRYTPKNDNDVGADPDMSSARLSIKAVRTSVLPPVRLKESSYDMDHGKQDSVIRKDSPASWTDSTVQTMAAPTTSIQPTSERGYIHCELLLQKPLLLPLELHELILDNFWDYTDTSWNGMGYYDVRNCSKVCSRWYAAARPFLFRSIVLNKPKRLTGLISLIQDDPNIAPWIRKIVLRGVTEPLYPFGDRQPDDVEKDPDNWLYPFPLGFGTPLPSLKILELQGLAVVSRRREDCEAFAGWIPGLATLTSVERMTLSSCEMSSNSATAILRAFPGLTDLEFFKVDFSRPNVGLLVDKSLTPAQSPDPPRPASLGIIEGSSSNDTPQSNAVEYPLLYPPPSLQSLRATNAQIHLFNFNTLRDCLCPKMLSRSLRKLIIGYQVDMKSVATFVSNLGVSHKLNHLQLHVGWYRQFFVDCKIDISALTSLEELTLLSDQTSTTEISLNCRQLLAQVDPTHLRTITLIVFYDETYIIKQLDGIDADLAQEKFGKLEKVSVKLINIAWSTESSKKRRQLVKELRPKIKKLLPLTTKRGILRISAWYSS